MRPATYPLSAWLFNKGIGKGMMARKQIVNILVFYNFSRCIIVGALPGVVCL
jgi:hypothetical protein